MTLWMRLDASDPPTNPVGVSLLAITEHAIANQAIPAHPSASPAPSHRHREQAHSYREMDEASAPLRIDVGILGAGVFLLTGGIRRCLLLRLAVRGVAVAGMIA